MIHVEFPLVVVAIHGEQLFEVDTATDVFHVEFEVCRIIVGRILRS